MIRTKKSKRATIKEQQMLSKYTPTSRTSDESYTSISSVGYTTSGVVNVSSAHTNWNYVMWSASGHVNITGADLSGNPISSLTSLSFNEDALQKWQPNVPTDASSFNIDPQRLTEKTRQPIPLEVMQSLKESAEILYNEVAEKNKQLEDVRYREIENQLSIMKAALERVEQTHQQQFSVTSSRRVGKKKMTEMITTFRSRFSEVPFLEQIVIKPTGEGIEAVFIHSSDNIVKAIETIVNILAKLQDDFPTVYIEPKVIPKSEIPFPISRGEQIIKLR